MEKRPLPNLPIRVENKQNVTSKKVLLESGSRRNNSINKYDNPIQMQKWDRRE